MHRSCTISVLSMLLLVSSILPLSRGFVRTAARLPNRSTLPKNLPPSSSFATTRRRAKTRNQETDSQRIDRPVVQWYPGHIAKAERQLQETIKAVDVILEIRDARVPLATGHPQTATWCAGKPRILVVTRVDAVPKLAIQSWKFNLKSTDEIENKQIQNMAKQNLQNRKKYDAQAQSQDKIFYVDAKRGEGVRGLVQHIVKTGQYVQERRQHRGLLQRPLRVGVLGYPNSGKSSLINKILGRKRARTANIPGVTKSLQWIKVKDSNFELLDAPGIIPNNIENQDDAQLLACCNCIGQAAYDNQIIASFLGRRLLELRRFNNKYIPSVDEHFLTRYRIKLDNCESGDDVLYSIADNTCQGSPEDAARKLLQDFRTGRLGLACLQIPKFEPAPRVVPEVEPEINPQAIQVAQQRGLELPPTTVSTNNKVDVGKGMFEGW